MDSASEAKFFASRKDFLTLDSAPLANRKQDIKFGNRTGNEFFLCKLNVPFPVF